MAAAPVVLLRRLAFVSSAVELAAAVPAAAAAPPSSMTLLAPVARPPVARLLVVSDLSRAWFARLIRSRCSTPVALHAPREIHVRAVGALPVAVPDARGRRAGPAAPVRRLRLGLGRGLFHKNRVPREVRRFPHACGPVTRGSPVGHFVATCSATTRGRCAAASRVGALRLASRALPGSARRANLRLYSLAWLRKKAS